jgi:hypothetical protein
MSDVGQQSGNHPLRIRWVHPAWLNWGQVQTYCGLPPYILHGLLANHLLRRAGAKIARDSIDHVLLEANINGQPIFWGC